VHSGIDQLRSDVIFDDLGHQASQSAARAGDQVHDRPAVGLDFQRTLDRLDLSAQAADAGEQLKRLAIRITRISAPAIGSAGPAGRTDRAERTVAVRDGNAAAAWRSVGLVLRSAAGGNAEPATRKLIDLPRSAGIRRIRDEQRVRAVRDKLKWSAAGTGRYRAGERNEQRDRGSQHRKLAFNSISHPTPLLTVPQMWATAFGRRRAHKSVFR
jgi:hypothetical protein